MFHTNHMEDAAVMWIEVCFLWFHFSITSNFCILISYSNSEILNSNRFFHWKKNKHSRHFKLNSIYSHCQAVFQFIFRQCLFILHLKGGKNRFVWNENVRNESEAVLDSLAWNHRIKISSYISYDKLFIVW